MTGKTLTPEQVAERLAVNRRMKTGNKQISSLLAGLGKDNRIKKDLITRLAKLKYS